MSGSWRARANGAGLALALVGGLLGARGCFPNPDDLREKASSASTECASFASTWCAKMSVCEPVISTYTFGDDTTCRQRMGLYCTSILMGESDTAWNATSLATCGASWSSLSCPDWINDPAEFPGAACRVPGHRAAGAACARDLQCATQHCIYASGTDSCGKCGAAATQGQACFSAVDCATGLGCSDNGACAPWGNVGDACGADRPCHNTLQCRSGVCATYAAPGAVCSSTVECDLAQGVLCNSTTGKCGAAVAASTCDSSQSDGKVRYCASHGLCNTDGTCTSSAADGKACSDTGARCISPAFCSSAGICTLPSTGGCT